MLRSRISRRVITEQHIALTQQFRERQDRISKGKGRELAPEEESRVGLVDTKLNAADVIRKCEKLLRRRKGPEGKVPIVIEGSTNVGFAYIEEHLESVTSRPLLPSDVSSLIRTHRFMLYELIKNAAHATVQAHGDKASDFPVQVTIVHQPRDLTIRVSDRGNGIPPYGGLPPDPLDLSLMPRTHHGSPPTSPQQMVSNAPLLSQRLDIFSFSHMRRHYQHHTALMNSSNPDSIDSTFPSAEPFCSTPLSAGASPLPYVAPTGEVELPDLHSSPSPPILDPTFTPAEAAAAISPLSPHPSASSSPSTGIMALRSIGSQGLTGTVSEQVEEEEEENLLDAQMRSGIGLPLSQMYASYFGGNVWIHTIQGWGSDARLRIQKFGLAA